MLQLPLQPHAYRCLDKVEVSASKITLTIFWNAFGWVFFYRLYFHARCRQEPSQIHTER